MKLFCAGLIEALDITLVVAVLVLEVGVESRDNSDHADGGPGSDDGVDAPLGSPALSLKDLGSGLLTVPGVILPANPGIFDGATSPPVEESHADCRFLLTARVSRAGVEALQNNPLQQRPFWLAIFFQLETGSQSSSPP